MAKRMIDLTTERPMTGSVRGHRPAVIRVRRQSKYGRVTYYMNNWLPVPPILRHLDGRSVLGVALALLLALVVGAYALARLLLAGGQR